MFRPRVIPVLLLKDKALVKSIKFKNHNYIGDPINAVHIFNTLRVDELVFLDILATKEKRFIDINFIKMVAEEANMPFSVGGGITNINQIRQLVKSGAEKVIIGSYALERPDFIKEASNEFGSSTIMVCMDVGHKFFGKEVVFSNCGTKSSKYTPEEFAKLMEYNGAGELIVQSIGRDGTMLGYDLELTRRIANSITIPLITLGGANSLNNLKEAYTYSGASAMAAGSFFVYQGLKKGVLINYPDKKELLSIRL